MSRWQWRYVIRKKVSLGSPVQFMCHLLCNSCANSWAIYSLRWSPLGAHCFPKPPGCNQDLTRSSTYTAVDLLGGKFSMFLSFIKEITRNYTFYIGYYMCKSMNLIIQCIHLECSAFSSRLFQSININQLYPFTFGEWVVRVHPLGLALVGSPGLEPWREGSACSVSSCFNPRPTQIPSSKSWIVEELRRTCHQKLV